jgi:Lysozyme like domain
VTWETDILGGLQAPSTPNNVSKLDAWNQCEGNASGASGLPINNPFNTTLNYGGGQSVNSAGVKAYGSWQIGLQATLLTLGSSYYTGIVTNLRQDGTGQQFANAVGNSPWGTNGSCIANALGTTTSGLSPGGGSGVPSGVSVGPGNVQYSYAQLEGIWIQAGGNPQYANIAAAVAMAESGGNSAAYDNDSNGSVDRGLWQINSVHGTQSTFDVMGNARAAVAISNNGTTWSPWVTYQTGAYQQYLQSNVPPDLNAPINGTNAAAGTGGTPATLTACNTWETFMAPEICVPLNVGGGIVKGSSLDIAGTIINGLVGSLVNPIIGIVAGILGIGAGAILMGGGIMLIVKDTQTYQNAKQASGEAVGLLGFLAGPEAGAATETAAKVKSGARPPQNRAAILQQQAASSELNRRDRATARAQAKQLSTQQLLQREAARYN